MPVNPIGKWAICTKGRIGRPEKSEIKGSRIVYVGTGLDGKPWESVVPKLVASSDQDVLDAVWRRSQLKVVK